MKILIAYDGSDQSRAAIADLALAGLPQDTEAIVMTVADILPAFLEDESSGGGPEKILVRARAEAERRMAEAQQFVREGTQQVSTLYPSWKVSGDAVADSPYWAFVTRAPEVRADLIVVGSRGRSALQAVAFGSVSASVLHHATCSVRVGRATGDRPARPVKLLIGFDGSSHAADAVAAVAGRTWPNGSEARLLTAIDGLTLKSFFANQRAVGEFSAMIDRATAELRRAGLEVSTFTHEDDPRHLVLKEAERWSADAIFLGARGLSTLKRIILGSVSSTVAARAACSVEVVREAEK